MSRQINLRELDKVRQRLVDVIHNNEKWNNDVLATIQLDQLLEVIRSLPVSFQTLPLDQLFKYVLENSERDYLNLIDIVFERATFNNIANSLHFLKLLEGPGFRAARSHPDPFLRLHLIERWLKNQPSGPVRYVFKEDISDTERALLEQYGILISTDSKEVFKISYVDEGDFLRLLKDPTFDQFPRETWLASELIPDTIFSRSLALLKNWFDLLKTEVEAKTQYLHSWDSLKYASLSLMKTFFEFFHERYNNLKRLDDLEKLHQIIWFILGYLGDDSEAGIFRPYSKITSETSDILVDYLLLDPKNHLALFLMHNRDAQYSALIKYVIEYQGTESAGLTRSGWGLESELDDVPIAKYLFEPTLNRLYEESIKKDKIQKFWDLIRENWIKSDDPISSLNPVVLRRACIPVLAKMLAEGNAPNEHDIIATFHNVMNDKQGIPDMSSKIFSEIRSYNNLFSGEMAGSIRELVEKDISLTFTGIPSNIFCFECLLKLINAGDKKAESIICILLNNIHFQRQDRFDFSIIGNIDRICGDESPVMKAAVEKFMASPEWQKNASHYTVEAVKKYRAKREKINIEKSVETIASEKAAIHQLMPMKLSELANKDFCEFVATVRSIQKNRPLHKLFDDREFLVKAVENVFKEAIKQTELNRDNERIKEAITLCFELCDDPDPVPENEEDKRVRNGEKRDVIMGVRTHLCFAVAHLACLPPFLPQAWELTKKLFEDRSYYVAYFAFVPFIEILRRRTWDDDICKKSISKLWQLFENKNLPQSIQEQVLHSFNYVRNLSEVDAEKVLRHFADFENVEHLYIFYAIFREDYVNKMGAFDTEGFQRIFHDAIVNNHGDLPQRILQAISQVVQKDLHFFQRFKPYLLLYSGSQHANSQIVESGLRIANNLLNKSHEPEQAIEILSHFLKIEHQMLLQKKEKDYWGHFPDQNAFQHVYEINKDAFYNILFQLSDNIVAGGRYCLFDESIISILKTETEPGYIKKIREFWDKVVSHRIEFYSLRQEWLENH